MQRGGNGAKPRSLRRSELLLLEIQKDILEYRIRSLEKQPSSTDRGLKRELPVDRTMASKRPKHEVTTMTVEEMFNQCSKLLTQLKKHNNSGPFLAPVDPIALNCPDYFEIVKKPMDFKTITAKLRPAKRIYNSPLDFRDDIRQVFKNCSLYNPIGNQIRIMGDRLSKYFEDLWMKSNIEKMYLKIQPGLKRSRNGDDMNEMERSKKVRTHDTAFTLKKLDGIRNKMQELIQKTEENMTSMEMDAEAHVSFWQKRRLNAELENADAGVIKKLAKEWPEKLESVEMVMDDMSDVTLRRLWSCVISPSRPETKEIDTPVMEQKTDRVMDNKQAEDETHAMEVVKGDIDDVTADVKGDTEDAMNEEAAEKPTEKDDNQPMDVSGALPAVKPKETSFLHPASTVDTGGSPHLIEEHPRHPFVAEAFGSVIPVDSGKVEETNEPTADDVTVEESMMKTEEETMEMEVAEQMGPSEGETVLPVLDGESVPEMIDCHKETDSPDVDRMEEDCQDDSEHLTEENKDSVLASDEDRSQES